ncbi:MAG TPA: bifunctional [glutamine synthetase] adenylyltransferase/[glutamine synthetase]-adenylyl-L-tyrosine phosphorylase [Rugosimonospora sp.]|nr:bifunctional [glutamine synthetase] adenylyltransferase/[glutamine synthetase]-adenylyl-L-tyrosine phosphorylase [Rugosimonospora sp.]
MTAPFDRVVTATGQLARFGFTDAARDSALLADLGLWNPEEQRPVDEPAHAVLRAFPRVALPDLALRQLHRLAHNEHRTPVAGGPGSGRRAGLLVSLRTNASLRERLLAVLGASETLGDHLVANPGEWRTLASPHGYALRFEGATVGRLRMAYRRSLLRIAAGDLTGALDLEQTMTALSALADATLQAAYRLACAERAPGPDGAREPSLAVVAMGKCGGRELNYVSDVDVIFVTASDEDLAPATTVAARLMEICGLVAWPVDAALRPEGGRGPLVRTLASHLAYYQRWARTWEFQALLKARPAAGDLALGRQWLDALQPLVWRAAERPEAVEDIRQTRRRIVEAVPRKELDREIKRGPGGLRDIEFAVQLLQLVHGRADETLRSPSTLDALRALVAGGYVGRADGEALDAAYQFLRTVEHRLQLQKLRRTHTVPADDAGLRWLAGALGYPGTVRSGASPTGGDAVAAFRAAWIGHATEVRRLHAKLLYRPLLTAVARVPGEELRLTTDAAQQRLEVLGFADPPAALRHIQSLTGGVSRSAAIQRQLLPAMLSEFADAPEPDRGLLAYRQVSERLGATPWYLRLLRDGGPVALRLAYLLGLSRYVTDLLLRDPEALRLLADDTELTPRPPQVLSDGFRSAANRHADPLTAVHTVRALRRRELFRIACADLLGLPLGEPGQVTSRSNVLRVGRALSGVTDATLAGALEAAQATLLGPPGGGASGGTGAEPGPGNAGFRFAIIGMGRLGGYEASYSSDADVLFVYEPAPGQAEDAASGVAHEIAGELRRLLAVPAPEPPLGVDADLRPEGRQGPLVRSLAAYQAYYAKWSRVWEAQALLRARYVAGDPVLAQRFLALADSVRYPTGGLEREQVTEIRRIKARVDTERLPRGADPALHAKLGRGGLADVEWTVQLLQLRHGFEVPGLRTTATLDALGAARDAHLVDAADAQSLATAWVAASRVRNALMLVRGRPSDQLPRHGPELAGVVRILSGRAAADPGEFVDDYLRTARRARQVAERLVNE